MKNEHRCFLAIDIEPDLIKNIEKVQSEFKKTNNNVKYVEKENLHFTLKFFGNINQDKIKDVINSTEKVLANLNNSNKFNTNSELLIESIGTFPNENYMKVLWIGTKQNDFLNTLHKELDQEFQKIGFKLDKKFKTHLTIGRIRNLKDKNDLKSKINELKDIKIGKMNINKLSLKKSELTPKGPIYSDIKIFNL